jgi:hypothetical protein
MMWLPWSGVAQMMMLPLTSASAPLRLSSSGSHDTSGDCCRSLQPGQTDPYAARAEPHLGEQRFSRSISSRWALSSIRRASRWSAASSPFLSAGLRWLRPRGVPVRLWRDMSSGKSQTVSHSKTIESAEGTPTAEPNGS